MEGWGKFLCFSYFLIYLQGEQNGLGKSFSGLAYLLRPGKMKGQVRSFDNLVNL